MAAKPPIDVTLRIHCGPSAAVGPGKIALLEQIAIGGSLARAAAKLEISYRRAWAMLQDLERGFGEPVAIRTVGGSTGGGAQLTPFARRLIAAYRAVEWVAAERAAAEFARVVAAPIKVRKARGSRRARSQR